MNKHKTNSSAGDILKDADEKKYIHIMHRFPPNKRLRLLYCWTKNGYIKKQATFNILMNEHFKLTYIGN